MDRLLFILSISFGSIAAGYITRRVTGSRTRGFEKAIPSISRFLKLLAFFFLNPVAVVSTFWGASLPDGRVLALPLLGLGSVFAGMLAAYTAIKLMRIPPERAGSVFACGAFGNVLTIGGLIAYTFFREPGYFLVQLTNLTMYPAYFLLGYPISANIGLDRKPVFRLSLASFKENPFLVLPLAATAVGISIRLSGIPRPDILAGVVAFVVPISAAVLGFSIGLTLRFTRVKSYLGEITAVIVIRHLLLPLLMIPAAILLGFGNISDGLPLKITIILSCMPVAFSALVPAAIYGFDLDLANSAWMVSTGLLAVTVPLLFVVFHLIL